MILSLLNHNPYGYDNSFSSFYYSVPLIVIHLLWSQLVFGAIVVGEEIVFLITISLLVDYSVDYFFYFLFLFLYSIFVCALYPYCLRFYSIYAMLRIKITFPFSDSEIEKGRVSQEKIKNTWKLLKIIITVNRKQQE